MRCWKVRRRLSDYVDGRLDCESKAGLENHIKECEVCARHLVALRKADEIVRLKTEEEPRAEYWDSFWPRLKAKLGNACPTSKEDEPIFSGHRSFLHPFPAWQACMNVTFAVLLVLALGLLYRGSREVRSLRAMLREQEAGADALRWDIEARARIASAMLSEQSIRSQFRIFQEVRDMFPHTIQWLVTNNGEVNVGLSDRRLSENTSVNEDKPVFLKFHVVRYDRRGEIVSSPDMMVLPDNEVNGTLNVLSGKDGTVCRYRCLPTISADRGANVVVAISLGDSVLRTVISADDGNTVELGKIRNASAEYSIYLTVFFKDSGPAEIGSEPV